MSISRHGAIIGVSDHAGWAVLVTVAGDRMVLDSRRVELVDADLPRMPHHHEGHGLPLEQAVELVERVRASADQHAKRSLDALEAVVAAPIRGVALRACPPLPPTIAERIQNYRAQNVADWVMYRMALADAASSRGWSVYWYNAKTVLTTVCETLPVENLDAYFLQAKKAFGPPWTKDHKVATAAAINASLTP